MINKKELRIVSVLSGIFALRMLGLCMLLPVFATEALRYSHANSQLIGVAIGIYGLAQALLQIPFGVLSDKYGRKPLILIGLAFIGLGSFVAAIATSIYGLILGRILQGCGAIGSVVIALLADHVREEARTSAMAILGASIGLSFALAFVLGPWLNQSLGLTGLFLVILVLSIVGSLLLLSVPKSNLGMQPQPGVKLLRQGFSSAISNMQLVNLNFGVFVLHASLAAIFLILPGMLLNSGINVANVWRLYLLALIIAMLVALRLIGGSEKRNNTEQLQGLAILGLLIAEIILYTVKGWQFITVGLIIFFTAFCILESSLPMLVSKYAPAKNRGAALGVYSCLQFLGMFVGGVVGGWLHGSFGAPIVFGFCVVLAACWLFISVRIKKRGVQLWQEA